MSDKQDPPADEIQVIGQKLKSAAIIEAGLDALEQTKVVKSNNGRMSCQLSDGKKSYTIEGDPSIRNLPELDLPEKILFVIDTVREKDYTPYKLGAGTIHTPLFMIKRAVETFVNAKSTIKRAHEFALMTLTAQSVHWICEFTNNIKSIVNHLDTIREVVIDDVPNTYDLGQVFEKIQTRIALPVKNHSNGIPSFATRVILTYARSNCMPQFQTSQIYLDNLTVNSYFFLDVLYVHEPPSPDNMCEDVYAEIGALDRTNFSYILEVGRSAAKLHDNMAKLLAHPLQRPPQKDACYTIHTLNIPQEVHTNV